MDFRTRIVCAAFASLQAVAIWGQQGSPPSTSAPIVRPGAPGQNSTILSAETARSPERALTQADIYFMQGMIHHHSQAVEMTDLMKTRTHNKELLAFGKRISISQTDEMQFMRQWLTEHGQPTTMSHAGMNHDMANMKNMAGMHHDMAAMPMMPGMLTPEQMQALAKASGKNFDRLFLTGMIQHHTGALVMVEDLLNTPGAGQDSALFDFATDVDNTQRAEIEIMRGMLKDNK